LINLLPHPDGFILTVRAQPRARQAGVVGEHGGALKVAVVDPPEKGKANESIVRLLADYFGLKRNHVRLVSGASSRDKRFLLECREATELQKKLEQFSLKSAP
jgi:uncharacterized protein (TIGR00251 family)